MKCTEDDDDDNVDDGLIILSSLSICITKPSSASRFQLFLLKVTDGA